MNELSLQKPSKVMGIIMTIQLAFQCGLGFVHFRGTSKHIYTGF